MKFENEKAMYDAIQNGLDLYNINTGDYVFSYSDRGAIAVYNLVLEYAKDLSSHSAGEYWGALLGAGGDIYENGGEIEWCEEHYKDNGWKFTEDLDKEWGEQNDDGKAVC